MMGTFYTHLILFLLQKFVGQISKLNLIKMRGLIVLTALLGAVSASWWKTQLDPWAQCVFKEGWVRDNTDKNSNRDKKKFELYPGIVRDDS